MARRTDSNSPADWLFIASGDLEGVRELASRELAFAMCVSKLVEILEKIIKAELIRMGWFLVMTHDLIKLVDELRDRDAQLADRFQPLCEELAERYFTDRYPGFDLEDEDWHGSGVFGGIAVPFVLAQEPLQRACSPRAAGAWGRRIQGQRELVHHS